MEKMFLIQCWVKKWFREEMPYQLLDFNIHRGLKNLTGLVTGWESLAFVGRQSYRSNYWELSHGHSNLLFTLSPAVQIIHIPFILSRPQCLHMKVVCVKNKSSGKTRFALRKLRQRSYCVFLSPSNISWETWQQDLYLNIKYHRHEFTTLSTHTESWIFISLSDGNPTLILCLQNL